MGFPFTTANATWKLSDFQDGKYHENLGQFLWDCMQEYLGGYSAVFTSSFLFTTTALPGAITEAIFTIPTGLAFQTGQKVRIMRTNGGYLSAFMEGDIESYNSTTGVMTIVMRASGGAILDNVEYSITLNGSSQEVSYGDVGLGGTGSDDPAQSVANLTAHPYPWQGTKEFLEDFVGYYPPSSTGQIKSRFETTSTGTATAEIAIPNENIPFLHEHPGLLKLSSSIKDQYSALVCPLRYGEFPEDLEVCVCLYIPELSQSVGESELVVGFDNSTYNGSSLPDNYVYFDINGEAWAHCAGEDSIKLGTYTRGRWIYIHFTYSNGQLTMFGDYTRDSSLNWDYDDENQEDLDTFANFTIAAPILHSLTVYHISKDSSKATYSYVDYVHAKNTSNP